MLFRSGSSGGGAAAVAAGLGPLSLATDGAGSTPRGGAGGERWCRCVVVVGASGSSSSMASSQAALSSSADSHASRVNRSSSYQGGWFCTSAPDSSQAAMIEPAAVAVYAVDRGGVTSGSTVLVSGVGPIGALTLLAVKAAGAAQIFVSEPNLYRRTLAKQLVPDAICLDPMKDDVAAFIKEHTEEGVGVDVALECVGLEASLNTCAASVRRQGKVVQTGLHMKPASIDAMLWALKDITLEATWCYPVQIWPRIIRMVESGTFPIEKIVTGNIAAEDVVTKGFDALLDKSVNHMKILVTV